MLNAGKKIIMLFNNLASDREKWNVLHIPVALIRSTSFVNLEICTYEGCHAFEVVRKIAYIKVNVCQDDDAMGTYHFQVVPPVSDARR